MWPGRILDSLARPLTVDGHEIFVTASIGISCFPSDGQDADSLLKAADAAMYRAKELGRNQAQLFTASMNERYARRLALEQHLHHALERDQLELYYQPVYDRSRRKYVSVEALLRWHDPARGMVPPEGVHRPGGRDGHDHSHRSLGVAHGLPPVAGLT